MFLKETDAKGSTIVAKVKELLHLLKEKQPITEQRTRKISFANVFYMRVSLVIFSFF